MKHDTKLTVCVLLIAAASFVVGHIVGIREGVQRGMVTVDIPAMPVDPSIRVPTDQVTGVITSADVRDAVAGSLLQPAVVPEPGPMEAYTRTMKVTAYCPCKKCCGEFADGITASGKLVTYNHGKFAAAPKSIKFGTLVSIPGYNFGIPVPIEDRGGAIKDGCLDVFFPTHREALCWGVKYLDAEFMPRSKCPKMIHEEE